MEPISIAAIYIFGALVAGPVVAETVGPAYMGASTTQIAATWPVSVPAIAVIATADALEDLASTDSEDSPWSVE